nr:hypothetical protein [Tanacetum cinerariifolium]
MRPPRHLRNENLKNWKWEAVIIIDDADDKKEVVETENNVEVLFRVFDEEEDEDEGENKKPWELDDEVSNEDETDEENEVDDEDEWP